MIFFNCCQSQSYTKAHNMIILIDNCSYHSSSRGKGFDSHGCSSHTVDNFNDGFEKPTGPHWIWYHAHWETHNLPWQENKSMPALQPKKLQPVREGLSRGLHQSKHEMLPSRWVLNLSLHLHESGNGTKKMPEHWFAYAWDPSLKPCLKFCHFPNKKRKNLTFMWN